MKKRWFWLGAIAIGFILLLTLFAAPSTNKLNSGSTYNRAPDGYGAWYAFMEKQGTLMKRTQQPFDRLPKNQRITLLRVNSRLSRASLTSQERTWVEQGNTLVVLGVWQPVTDAAFSTMQESPAGSVKIETTRRLKKLQAGKRQRQLLGDRFGTVVWEEPLGKGQAIFATTSNVAANAYQDEPGNFKFLATLVTEKSNAIWVDEYIHGYKDKEIIVQESGTTWVSYLAKTPFYPALLQVGVILIVLFLAKNWRLGAPVSLTSPTIDNSEAYIQALAGVLQKAESTEFVLQVVGKEEQMQLQEKLGLGQIPLDKQTLVRAWVEQTHRPAAELEDLLPAPTKKRRMREKDLLTWLKKWQTIRHYLSSHSNLK